MSPKNKSRKNYLNINNYQKRIIYLMVIPTLTICVVVSIMLHLFYRDMLNVIVHNGAAPGVEFINRWRVHVMIVVWSIFIAFFVKGYMIAANLVGAFVRILRELDEIIEGKKKTTIQARANDDLANAVLKRINVLVQGYKPPSK